jgi:type II secretory pathway pseudopilin PulG
MGRVTMLVVLAIVGVLYGEHIISLLGTRAQAQGERSIVRALARQNRALLAQQRALSDPSVIQLRARALGMVRAGERSYAITGVPGG